MQVYAIYAPAHHTPGKVQAAAAAAAKDDEPAARQTRATRLICKNGSMSAYGAKRTMKPPDRMSAIHLRELGQRAPSVRFYPRVHLGFSATHEQQSPPEHYRPDARPYWDVDRLLLVH